MGLRHATCIPAGVLQLLTASSASPSPHIQDLDPALVDQLGGACVRLPGENAEAFSRRFETALMVLFRETRSGAVFTVLYESTKQAMGSWILHLCSGRGQRKDPLDLVQDTFVNIYRYAGSFRDGRGGGFRGWARTIAANVVRRAHQRSARATFSELPEGSAEPVDPRMGPAAACQSAEQQAELARAWTFLLLHYAAAWETLSPRDREALTLVEVDGKSYTEAGSLLKVGRSNMKMIMFRARKRIRLTVLKSMAAGEPAKPQPEIGLLAVS
ncbi:MAG: RNA polymerase sigma factor (sigma-70 family) [Planctomycetota bacterium]|jgi:RNA polymerase sigma factor (sigma-70 family)